ncbi:MAG: hypothetical protein HY721_03000 [Planctomycetes bacterium]|nr:hypothetical protein [Planctomycetota bacterium]
MSSEATHRATRLEWRKLGFFYCRDDEAKEYRLVGSRPGLLMFRDLLLEYVADPRNQMQAEHAHYGPYMYLKVMTWPNAGIDAIAIRGTLVDLRRLAQLIESQLRETQPGSVRQIGSQYSADSKYSLVLDVRGEDFDPSSADPLLPAEASDDRDRPRPADPGEARGGESC